MKPYAGFKERWSNSGGNPALQGTHNTSAKLGLGFDIRPVQGVSFTLLAENLVPVSDRKDAVNISGPKTIVLF